MATFRIAFLFILLSACATPRQVSTRPLTLSEVTSGSPYTVVYFFGTKCPCVKRYQTRIEDLHARYKSQGFRFVAISSNSDDTDESVQETAAARSFQLPILRDHSGQIAKSLHAHTTPTVVVLDSKGNTLYRGWIDNERYEGEAGRVAYLENAILDLSHNRPVAVATSPIYGCRITKRLH